MIINIGKHETGYLNFDLSKLVETRLLITANSGGGKSWLIRKFLEESYGKVQHIILDMEGEFATLREKFDYVLAGKGGDIAADPRFAAQLAKKILELKASLIVDLYELKQPERIKFVKLFLDAMVNAPKDLWHPVIVVLDEAHNFAPEKRESEATSAVIDLATRGRKRGYCLIPATQRLSKLHKDVAAECINKLIGRTGLDIDMKRASEELGFTSKQQMLELRDLEPGQFFAFGPAVSKSVVKAKVGKVETAHPVVGQRVTSYAPATSKVKAILAKLEEIPKEAAEEQDTLKKLSVENSNLKAEIRKINSGKSLTINASFDEKAVKIATEKAFKKAEEIYSRRLEDFKKIISSAVDKTLKEFHFEIKHDTEFVKAHAFKDVGVLKDTAPVFAGITAVKHKQPNKIVMNHHDSAQVESGGLGKCEKMILNFLVMRGGHGFTKVQIGAMTGYSHGSGGFNNAISKLKQGGLILQLNDRYYVQKERVDEIQFVIGTDYNGFDDTDALRTWLDKLGKCPKQIYEILLENRGSSFTKEELGEMTKYSPSSGGFNNALSHLNTLGLTKKENGQITLNPDLDI